jgi:hypothetical protein
MAHNFLAFIVVMNFNTVCMTKWLTVMADPSTGFAVYALPGEHGLKASSHRVGSIDPLRVGNPPKPDAESRKSGIR